MPTNADKPDKPKRRWEASLSKGDTIFLPGGRVTIKKTGANGGRVKVSIASDGAAKVVKQKGKHNG